MLPILSAPQIKAADAYTIANEPVAAVDLMERASVTFCKWFTEKFPDTSKPVFIFCGKGNNGGDGLAVARLLLNQGFTLKVFVVGNNAPGSDFQINHERLVAINKNILFNIQQENDLPEIPANTTIIDALFGSGLNKPLEGIYKSLIEYLNNIEAVKVSVDIPSGLFCDERSEGIIFKAQHTFSFELPKYAFLLPENNIYVGDFYFESIGLNRHFIQEQITTHWYITFDDIVSRFRPRNKFGHKGTYGHSLIIAGSYGKMGAAALAAKAALHSGSGLVTVYIPQCGYAVLQTAVPEAMVICDEKEKHISAINIEQRNYSAIGVGMALGNHKKTAEALFSFLENQTQPLVLDADALNILAANTNYLHLIPKHTIITPHPKEFERLFGKTENDYERHQLQIRKAVELGIIIILKGANTAIALPDGNTYFNSTGNPGMATAGSGDVLTGIITALLVQGYSAEDAAIMGVYIHGKAGDVAATEKSQTYITATDIIEALSSIFLSIERLAV